MRPPARDARGLPDLRRAPAAIDSPRQPCEWEQHNGCEKPQASSRGEPAELLVRRPISCRAAVVSDIPQTVSLSHEDGGTRGAVPGNDEAPSRAMRPVPPKSRATERRASAFSRNTDLAGHEPSHHGGLRHQATLSEIAGSGAGTPARSVRHSERSSGTVQISQVGRVQRCSRSELSVATTMHASVGRRYPSQCAWARTSAAIASRIAAWRSGGCWRSVAAARTTPSYSAS